ncbi:MAG: hypothetical protein GX032_03215 [Tenericutes bacterium]|nr:hypothetical protein [Mycoplasmatota bacterium]
MNKLIIKKDFNDVLSNKKTILSIIFVLIMVVYINSLYMLDKKAFYVSVMGINNSIRNFEWLDLLVFLFYVFIYTYLSLFLFTKDLKNSLSNIFLRIHPKNYILYKMFSIFFITLLALILQNIFIIILEYVFTKGLYLNFDYFFKNLLFIYLFQSTFIFIYIISSRYKMLTMFWVLMLLIAAFMFDTIVINYNLVYLILLIVFINTIILIGFSKLFKDVFEKKKEMIL